MSNHHGAVSRAYRRENDGSGTSVEAAKDIRQGASRKQMVCDKCRLKKMKCDKKSPTCTYCSSHGYNCTYNVPQQRRGRPRTDSKDNGASLSLEYRIESVEALLQSQGLLDRSAGVSMETLQSRLAKKSSEASQQFDPASQSVTEDDALADQMTSLTTNEEGQTRFMGSSSGFSIVSPRGRQWVDEKVGDKSFSTMIASALAKDRNEWDEDPPNIFDGTFTRRLFKPLPSRTECLSLVGEFFDQFNQMFPLFHKPTFLYLIDRQYSDEPYEGNGWWASINIALATAYRIRAATGSLRSEEASQHAWEYFKNAMAVSSELIVRNTDLLSVQALLGLALFLRGTSNPQAGFAFTSAAMRLAHTIGLHKSGRAFTFNPVESEQRNRVFWIAYLLDKDTALRSGIPPSQDDDDMNIQLPMKHPPDHVGRMLIDQERSQSPSAPFNFFRIICRLAQIQSMIYKHLYSVRASRKSDAEILQTVELLDGQLNAWRTYIPGSIRPGHDLEAESTPSILHAVTLHFAYYSCVNTVHRLALDQSSWSSRLQGSQRQEARQTARDSKMQRSAELCVDAARRTISLIKFIPPGDHYWIWSILYYPVSALATLFTHILQHPKHINAHDDLKRLSEVLAFLSQLERNATQGTASLRRLAAMCKGFYEIAELTTRKAEEEESSTNVQFRRENDRTSCESNSGTREQPPKHADDPQPSWNTAENASQSNHFDNGKRRQDRSDNIVQCPPSNPCESETLPLTGSQRDYALQQGDEDVCNYPIMNDTNLNDFSVPESFWPAPPIVPGFPSTKDFSVSQDSYEPSAGCDAVMGASTESSGMGLSVPQSLTLPEMASEMDGSAGPYRDQFAAPIPDTHEKADFEDPWHLPMSLQSSNVDGMEMGWDLFDGKDLDADLMSLDTPLMDDTVPF